LPDRCFKFYKKEWSHWFWFWHCGKLHTQ